MKVQRNPSVGLAFLSAALALLSSDVLASTTTSVCTVEFNADGFCDDTNNNEACGFDGGDCCSCTCVSGAYYDCGENIGFNCIDPTAPCVGEETSFSSACIPDFFSDGDCDLPNNTEECGYDGGDCCACTCLSTGEFSCGDGSHGGYSCLDPSAPCVDDDDVTTLPTTETFSDSGSTTGTTTTFTGTTTGFCLDNFISDGDCDLDNNNEDCDYDGGDCCECTCVSTGDFTCGDGSHGGYSCLDPSAPCVDDDDVTTLPSTEDFTGTTTTTSTTTSTGGCVDSFVSDGDCDLANNIEECGYDGGDCCECTCVSTDNFTCGDGSHGGFTCLDPSAPCVDDDDATTLPTTETFSTTSPVCIPEVASDGDCDMVNNNEECDYDGGDCCECTCVSTRIFECGDENHGGFACVDPSAPCVNDDDFTPGADDFYFDYDDDFSTSFEFQPCIDDFISDGDCDSANNNEECDFDGGDCCECSCVSTDAFTCGQNGFNCVDPSPSCIDGNVGASLKKAPTS